MKTITYDETKWKLAPIEPTVAMQVAGANFLRVDTTELNKAFMTPRIYKAMLEVSPTPPTKSEPAANVAPIKVEFDNALNDAGWEFIEAYKKHTGTPAPTMLFNHTKIILRDAIECWLKHNAADALAKRGPIL